jgi:RNA polymerase sigma-70 factor (ECF subfamily)
MTPAAPNAIAITKAVEAVLRKDRGRLLSALVARLRDFQLAEDALQEASLAALSHWGRSGMPSSPHGWLLRVALRRAIDRMRQTSRHGRHTADLALLAEDEAADVNAEDIPDERLRLIFTCCHPALDAKSQVALTLRSICGLTTADIARAFLDTEPTMGQRLSRAKAKIAAAGIPFAIPGPEQWPGRLNAVLTTVYLIFSTGYSAGPQEPRDLCAEAIFLAQLITDLCPDQAEVEGALALMLLTDARRTARTGPDGCTLPLADQDRRLWDAAKASRGRALLDAAMARRQPGPFQIKAAIAACDMADGGPDWPQIALLYAGLYAHEPTPVVMLNHAVAVAEAGDLPRALALLDPLDTALSDYQPFHAARAELLFRAGHSADSRRAYDRAIATAPSASDAAFLTKRRARLGE